MAAARARNIPPAAVQRFEAVAGQGVRARIDDKEVAFGNRKLMEAQAVAVGAADAEIERLAQEAATPMYLAVNGVLAGLVAVADPIKEDSRTAIERMLRLGLKVVMLTGDHRLTAEAVARRVGVDEVIAEVLPQVKAARFVVLQAQGASLTPSPTIAT